MLAQHQRRLEVPHHHARARARSGRCRLGCHRTPAPGTQRDPSARLSPPASGGSGLLRGDARPPGHRVQLGGRRAALWQQGLGHHRAARRDEWIEAGVFDAIAAEAIAAYDKIIGLDLSEVAVDGSLHKSPAGVREPARTRPIGPSSAGSGRSSPIQRHPHRLGHRRRQPPRLGPARPHARRRRRDAVCSQTSRRSGSTGAMTPTSRANA